MEARERQGKRAGGRERELEEGNKRKKGVRVPTIGRGRPALT